MVSFWLLLLQICVIALAQDDDIDRRKRQSDNVRTIQLEVNSLEDLMKLFGNGGPLAGLAGGLGGGLGGGNGNPLSSLGGLGGGGNPLSSLGGGGNPLSSLGGLGGGGNPLSSLGGLGVGGNPLSSLGGLGGNGNPLSNLGGLGGGGSAFNNLGNQFGGLANNALGAGGNFLGGNPLGGAGGGGGDFRQAALQETNKYRQQHGAAPLVLDDQLNRDCQAYAEQLARMNKMQHSCSNCGYGENLFMQGGMVQDSTEIARKAVTSWYNEVTKYDWNNPRFTSGTGHFTALVWKETRKMGFGLAVNQAARTTYVVARYVPAGNMQGAFRENVGRG